MALLVLLVTFGIRVGLTSAGRTVAVVVVVAVVADIVMGVLGREETGVGRMELLG